MRLGTLCNEVVRRQKESLRKKERRLMHACLLAHFRLLKLSLSDAIVKSTHASLGGFMPSLCRRSNPVRTLFDSEDTIDNVASNCGASAENGSVAHLLAKLLAILLEFAWLPGLEAGAGLTNSHW